MSLLPCRKDGTMKKGKILIILIIAALMLLAACGSDVQSDKNGPSDWFSSKTGRMDPNVYTDEYLSENAQKTVGMILSNGVKFGLEELVERSALVVQGTVEGYDYLTVRAVNGEGTENLTDYYIKVEEVLRGEPYDSEVITVREIGGENEESITINTEMSLICGEEYILFLKNPTVAGGGYTTDGNYYSIVGSGSGVYCVNADAPMSSNGAVGSTITSYLAGETEIAYTDFVSEINEFNETIPVNEDFYLEEAVKNYKFNLDSGFITQDEYDQAIDELKSYGEIVGYFNPS